MAYRLRPATRCLRRQGQSIPPCPAVSGIFAAECVPAKTARPAAPPTVTHRNLEKSATNGLPSRKQPKAGTFPELSRRWVLAALGSKQSSDRPLNPSGGQFQSSDGDFLPRPPPDKVMKKS